MSDQELLYCTTKKVKVSRSSVDFHGRSFRNYDKDQFIREFENCNWTEFDQCNDVEILWNIYENNIRTILDDMCPFKKFKIAKNRDPWISDDLINELKQKDYLLKRAK